MWNPAFSPQMYYNIKTPINAHNFNRYTHAPPPPIPAIHRHPNYMFTLPTKINYPAFVPPLKEIDEKRKQGNLHHITIINAIMPKPYLPTSPTLSHHQHHPTATFRNYRTNNKLLYTPQYFHNNNNQFVRQNVENLNKFSQQQHVPLNPLQQHQPQPLQTVYTSSPMALNLNTPSMEYMNVINYNTEIKNNDYEENEISNTVTKCGRKTKDDSSNSASDVLYYYCNNRITNYKNPTQQLQLYNKPSTTSSTTTTSTTTTSTTEPPPPPTMSSLIRTTAKSLDADYNLFTTEKLPIFLPTPNEPLENLFTPISTAFREQNTLNDLENNFADNFQTQRVKSRYRKYEDIRPSQYQRQRQPFSSYDNIKNQQQQFSTASPLANDNMKLHSFFTIEDAITRAPEMQVFNDPYQAYRHARRHHNSKHLKQSRTTSSSTIEPHTTTFTSRPKFKSFFDDLEEDEYILPENTAHYDFSLYDKPQKSSYFKVQYKNGNTYSKPNQISEHSHKPTSDNLYFNDDDVYLGKPKIREHNFGIFKALISTSPPVITTFKPYKDNLNDLFLTTSKILYNSQPISLVTTVDTVLGAKESESTTAYNKLSELRTTTVKPITTTTAKRFNRISLKSPLNLRSVNTSKYTNPREIQKSIKNLTSTTTTTTKATPTLKKVRKYVRQYKGKKLKQFKHLYTTTSSTSTTTTTTTQIPTTLETATKMEIIRFMPTTTTTTTEESTTKNNINIRTITDNTKIKKSRQQINLSTETPTGNKMKNKKRIFTTALTLTNNSNTSTRRPSHRRGTKRSNIAKNVITPSTPRKTENKSRRRLSASSTSSTSKPKVKRPTSTVTTSTTMQHPLRRSTSTTTTTTMKSIMRIANSKSRTKNNNDFKTPIRFLSNEANDDDKRLLSRITTSSTIASIPPLPIEIYFKKSQNAKI
ncbi:uncharacterized protein ACRADG_011543 isoform 1-T2 [Cochliomyia hominivorax]